MTEEIQQPPRRIEGKSKGRGEGKHSEAEAEKWRVVANEKIVVRRTPSSSGPILAARRPGDLVKVAFRQDEWVCLHSAEGFGDKQAWMLWKGHSRAANEEGLMLEPIESADARDAGLVLEPIESSDTQVSKGADEEIAGSIDKGDPAEELELLKMDKAQAVEDEDFEKAAALVAKIKAIEDGMREPKQPTSPLRALKAVKAEMEQCQQDKARAVEAEDYEQAADLRNRLKSLAQRAEELEVAISRAASTAPQDMLKVQEELSAVKDGKQKAVAEEDFAEASRFKTRQQELEARLEDLEALLSQ
jgi:protein-arginine kinase activator protein McsA